MANEINWHHTHGGLFFARTGLNQISVAGTNDQNPPGKHNTYFSFQLTVDAFVSAIVACTPHNSTLDVSSLKKALSEPVELESSKPPSPKKNQEGDIGRP